MQPKMGKLDIDYQVLHDAFFKHQTKPSFTIMGDVYYEGKEFEAMVGLLMLSSVDVSIPCSYRLKSCRATWMWCCASELDCRNHVAVAQL